MLKFKQFFAVGVAQIVLSAVLAPVTLAAEPQLHIIYLTHADSGTPFWLTVKKGMDDACQQVNASCQLIYVSRAGDTQGEVSNIEAAIAQKPDAIITSIPDDKAFDAVIKEAIDAGIPVIAANADDTQGRKGNARLAFVGQDFFLAGYALGKAGVAKFPAAGPIKVLVGVNMPQDNWSRRRAEGIINALQEFKHANPGRQISWDKIDAGTDYGTTSDRFGNYFTGTPDLTAYFDTGFWDVGVVNVLKDRGIAPGKIIIGGFDLVPDVLRDMKAGYIQLAVDQQPYLQGYVPIIEMALMKKYQLSPYDVDTGSAIVTPGQVDTILSLSKHGYR